MPLQKKPLPRPSLSLVLHPEGNRDYKHFEDAAEVPFENGASTMSRANAWWLADSSLLASLGPVGGHEALRQCGRSQQQAD